MEPVEKEQGFWSRVWNTFQDRLVQFICGTLVGLCIAIGTVLYILDHSELRGLSGSNMPWFFHSLWIFPLVGGLYCVYWGHRNRYRPARKKGEDKA
jgi:uncharacterized membrane protein YccC